MRPTLCHCVLLLFRDSLQNVRLSFADFRLTFPQFLVLCGAAYRPTEEIDLRSIGWGNIFQLPFKHLRDYRLRLLCPFFIYSGFEMLFAVSGFSLVRPCLWSLKCCSRVHLHCLTLLKRLWVFYNKR